MKALYDLRRFIAGFDFFPWLVMQQAHGATEIVFDLRKPSTQKWDLDSVVRRVQSILLPGPALIGLPYSLGREGAQLGPYYQGDLVALTARGMRFRRLRSVLPLGAAEYTVTLRRTSRAPARDSNEAAWRAFAAEIGARVIPDYEDEPIHLHERMALYAGARMNFFVTNGPAMLCFLSEYPAMQFCCHQSSPVKLGVQFGGRYPYCLPQHHMVWESDTLENIRRHFSLWKAHQ